jgi:hypothetical protein
MVPNYKQIWFNYQQQVLLLIYDSINNVIAEQGFWAFSIVIQMLCYCYGVDNAITLNSYEVIPLVMCNLGIL